MRADLILIHRTVGTDHKSESGGCLESSLGKEGGRKQGMRWSTEEREKEKRGVPAMDTMLEVRQCRSPRTGTRRWQCHSRQEYRIQQSTPTFVEEES
jgi:hypothetical protein